jgi:dynein heavy chain
MLSDLSTCIDGLFIFAIIWSVGATTNEEGRMMFDSFVRQEMFCNKFAWPIPKAGSIYDYLFSVNDKKWLRWIDIVDRYEVI